MASVRNVAGAATLGYWLRCEISMLSAGQTSVMFLFQIFEKENVHKSRTFCIGSSHKIMRFKDYSITTNHETNEQI